MAIRGGCHCGAIRYEARGVAKQHALCHCADCRRSAGAPMVGWAAFAIDDVKITGAPVTYKSSEHGRRQFCGGCGTGLFYRNDAVNLPGIIDIQSGTFDDLAALPAQVHIQTADRVPWMEDAHLLPAFPKFPEPG